MIKRLIKRFKHIISKKNIKKWVLHTNSSFFFCEQKQKKSETFIKTTIQVSLNFNEFVCFNHKKKFEDKID